MEKTIETAIESSHGQLTARMAREITPYWEEQGYYVLYDHDPASENVGKLVSSFGKPPYGRKTQLSQIDIAIVDKTSKKIFVLIEVEETNDKPKTILGDVFSVLSGEQINFGRKRPPLSVDKHTIFIVFVKSKVRHEERNEYLRKKVMEIKSRLSTANSEIGKVFIETFQDEDKLSMLLQPVFDKASREES